MPRLESIDPCCVFALCILKSKRGEKKRKGKKISLNFNHESNLCTISFNLSLPRVVFVWKKNERKKRIYFILIWLFCLLAFLSLLNIYFFIIRCFCVFFSLFFEKNSFRAYEIDNVDDIQFWNLMAGGLSDKWGFWEIQ